MKKEIFFLIFSAGLLVYPQLAGANSWQELHDQANAMVLSEPDQQAVSPEENSRLLYLRAIALFNRHQDLAAFECLDKLIRIDPEFYPAKWGQAEYYRRIYDYDKAKSILGDIIAEHPDFSPSYITLSYIKYMEMDFDEVLRLTGFVINQGKANVDLYTYLRAHCIYAGAKGMIAYRGGPLSKIINGPSVLRHLNIAKKLRPESVEVYFGFGCYYLLAPQSQGRNLETAEKFLIKAVTLDPLFSDGYVRLAQVYKLKGREELADLFLNKALRIDPQNILAKDITSNQCNFICEW